MNIERWFLSSNAKDIGVLYLIFALFSGLVGTAFSVLIRLELAGPGVQYIADSQLYNSIITAHAILMSAPLCLFLGCSILMSLGQFDLVRNYRGGSGSKLYGETQTSKPIAKRSSRSQLGKGLVRRIDLLRKFAVRFTNLILTEREYRPLYWTKALMASVYVYPIAYDIISVAIELTRILLTTQSGIHRLFNNILTICKQGPNSIPKTGTAGSPKGAFTRGLHGDGVIVVPTTLSSSMGRVTGSFLTMRKLSTKAGRNFSTSRGSVKVEVVKQDKDLLNIKAVCNINNLVSSYETIKSKKGNMSPGVNGMTLDGISLDYIKKLQSQLSAGKFLFSAARRVEIPKPGSNKTIPLSIAPPREKIVQQAIVNILSPAYEPTFSDSSHGLRPGRGTHTAIMAVEAKFDSVRYIIEADFSKAFDSINHDKLMEILKRRIKDHKLLKLI